MATELLSATSCSLKRVPTIGAEQFSGFVCDADEAQGTQAMPSMDSASQEPVQTESPENVAYARAQEHFDVSVSDQAVISTSRSQHLDSVSSGWEDGASVKLEPGRRVSLGDLPAEGRRLSRGGSPSPIMKQPEGAESVAAKAIRLLLKPADWKPPPDRTFPLSGGEVIDLCMQTEALVEKEGSCLRVQAPVKVFGDVHGQYADLMRLFDAYGSPSKLDANGDIAAYDYLFLGDYVDRGRHSLEVICLLFALKIENPTHVHLLRGNHEDASVNCMFGFMAECCQRLGQEIGARCWTTFNSVFNYLPVGALIADKILCIHGGIGQTVHTIADVEGVKRPCSVSLDGPPSVVKDLLWSDPTSDDSVQGFTSSKRGPGVSAFGPDQVHKFCDRNKIDLILRAHECVMDGIERFAGGRLITIFSATNYCGSICNAGAMVVIGRDLEVVPKIIESPVAPPSAFSASAHIEPDEEPSSNAPSPHSVLTEKSFAAEKSSAWSESGKTDRWEHSSLPFLEFADC